MGGHAKSFAACLTEDMFIDKSEGVACDGQP
jgi:hypothetical protein